LFVAQAEKRKTALIPKRFRKRKERKRVVVERAQESCSAVLKYRATERHLGESWEKNN